MPKGKRIPVWRKDQKLFRLQDHEASHISNVCRFCGLYSDHWYLLQPCPAREKAESEHAEALVAIECDSRGREGR